MNAPVLSVLDPSPLFEGKTGSDAYVDTIALAQATEQLGYRAFWVQEHHNTPSFASVAPEVLLAALGAHTKSIKLGSGGVMLPNYSPLKVAEQFAALQTLYPNRVELGIGRATGADPRASAALMGPGANEFPQMLRLLFDWLLDASGEQRLTPNHPAYGIKANPAGARPDIWMLCSSITSATFTGQMGLKLAFADFLSPGGAAPALQAYRDNFRPSEFADTPHSAIGLVVLASDTQEKADRLSSSTLVWNIARSNGRFIPFPSISVAEAQLAKLDGSAIEAVSNRAIVGTGQQVSGALKTLANETGAQEFFLLTIAETIEDRIKSYRLIAESYKT